MDFSKEYIRMCGSAKEVQILMPKVFSIKKGYGVGCSPTGDFYFGKLDDNNCLIWLPRQDQLQEMIEGDFIETCDYICHFSELFVKLKTPEKILLKIVMQEKFHKTWDSEKEEWV
jgi:hypothetical protein